MSWTGSYFVFIILLLCTFQASIDCSLPLNETLSSSLPGEVDIAPQFRPKSVEASKKPLIVNAGETIRRNCGVSGYPKPTVLFYKGNKILREPTPEDRSTSRVRIEHNTLRISPAKLLDSGNYTCVAYNNKSNTSLRFQVQVIKGNGPEITSNADENNLDNPEMSTDSEEKFKPRWMKVERMQKKLHAEPAGNTVKFQCRVMANPPPTMNWFKNGLLIKKHSRIGGFKYRNHEQMIILESVVPADDGMYMCKASNEYGSINHTYELDVQERTASSPYMAEGILQNETVFVGDDVTFKCKVFSDAHPHIEWIRSKRVGNKTDIDVLKSAGLNTTDSDMEVLLLKNVTFQDTGEYTCLAGNSIGISHRSAWLKVLPEPPPTTRIGAVPVSNGSNLLIYGIVGVLAIIVVIGISLFIYYNYYNGKDPPMLVPIKDPDNIPTMTKIEVPTMMYGNNEAWRRMCIPAQDQFDFNIPPDLQWELRREDIILTERLDEGFFGQVFKADLITPNARNEASICAVKMLKASRTEKDVLDLLSEMDQMKRVGKHKNIINLLGVCTQNGPLMLVIEYASEGNLREFLRRNRPQNMHCNLVMPTDIPNQQPENLPPQDRLLSQKDLVSYASQVSRGMDYLAQKKCVHRDLAARNVLVTEERVMKIADFGLARDIRSCDYYRKHTRGHLPYKWMALEAMADNVFTHGTDVWSFGVLLWEIFSLAGTPYPGIKTGELVKFLRSGERLEKPQFATQEMYMLMRDCWEEDTRRRPNFRSLVEDLERMLAEASNDEFISDYDAMAEYDDSTDSVETEEEDDDVFVQSENSDSLSDGNVPFNEEHDSFNSDPYAAPLLAITEENIMRNQHARLQSDV